MAVHEALVQALASEGFDGKLDVLVLNHVLGMWGWWLPSATTETSKPLLSPADMGTGKFSFEFAEKIFKVNIHSYIQLATLAMPGVIWDIDECGSTLLSHSSCPP